MNKNMKQYFGDAWAALDDLSTVLSRMESEMPFERQDPRDKPPIVWQRNPSYAHYEYSTGYPMTVGQSGCLLCSVYSLALWAGYGRDFLKFVSDLNVAGAFEGGYLSHPKAVTDAIPYLRWNHERLNDWGGKSRQDWVTVPADLGFIQSVLREQPLVVSVDFYSSTKRIDPHFALAYKYIEAPFDGSVEDDLLIMDPWTGTYSSVLTYFNPAWLHDGTMPEGITKVQRTVVGARAFVADCGEKKEGP